MSRGPDLSVKLFADGADKAGMLKMYDNPVIKGFTTNPTLMRKAGVTDYREFARDIIRAIPDRPISLEVFADDPPFMRVYDSNGDNHVDIAGMQTGRVWQAEEVRDLRAHATLDLCL